MSGLAGAPARAYGAPSMSCPRLSRAGFRTIVVLLVGLGTVSCSKKIGDKCSTSTDCSANGDRLCDTTQPDGYCTIFNCEPDTCPSGESACVAFTENSCLAATGGNTLPSLNRFERTFCMATCGDDGDCRGGYVCQDMGNDVVDTNPSTRRVCVVSPSTQASTDAGAVAVCEPGDGSLLGAGPTPDSAVPDAMEGVDGEASASQSGADGDVSTQDDGAHAGGGQPADSGVPDASAE